MGAGPGVVAEGRGVGERAVLRELEGGWGVRRKSTKHQNPSTKEAPNLTPIRIHPQGKGIFIHNLLSIRVYLYYKAKEQN